jgi:hypothetical protein
MKVASELILNELVCDLILKDDRQRPVGRRKCDEQVRQLEGEGSFDILAGRIHREAQGRRRGRALVN